MSEKVITLASKQAADELKTAVFKKWRADQLAQRGTPELDCYAGIFGPNGEPVPLPVQVTSAYVDAPAPTFADPTAPTAKELADYAASSQLQMRVDDVVLAMQGEKVDIGGKLVTIDVSTAVAVAGEVDAPAQPMTALKRTAVVGGSAMAGGAALAGTATALGLGPTMVAAGGALGVLAAGAVAFFKSATGD